MTSTNSRRTVLLHINSAFSPPGPPRTVLLQTCPQVPWRHRGKPTGTVNINPDAIPGSQRWHAAQAQIGLRLIRLFGSHWMKKVLIFIPLNLFLLHTGGMKGQGVITCLFHHHFGDYGSQISDTQSPTCQPESSRHM